MRIPSFALIAALSLLVPAIALRAQTPANAPLPDSRQLFQRALANEKKLAAEQERYECRITDDGVETDKNGKVKRHNAEVKGAVLCQRSCRSAARSQRTAKT